MNERIKDFTFQCWEPRQYGPAWFNSTKFAELIVKECMKEVRDESQRAYNYKFADVVTERVFKHFGVEL